MGTFGSWGTGVENRGGEKRQGGGSRLQRAVTALQRPLGALGPDKT